MKKIYTAFLLTVALYSSLTIYLTYKEEKVLRFNTLGDGLKLMYKNTSLSERLEKCNVVPDAVVNKVSYPSICVDFYIELYSLYEDERWRESYYYYLDNDYSHIIITPVVYFSTYEERWMYDRYRAVLGQKADSFFRLFDSPTL